MITDSPDELKTAVSTIRPTSHELLSWRTGKALELNELQIHSANETSLDLNPFFTNDDDLLIGAIQKRTAAGRPLK